MENKIIANGELVPSQESAKIQISNTVDTMSFIEIAVKNGVSTEQLSKLMDLHERWESRIARKTFNAAISELQSKVPEIKKTGLVGYTDNRGNTVGYTHAKLEDIAAAIKPLLSATGLLFRWDQTSEQESITITCVVSHKDGHSERTSMTAPRDTSGKKNFIQSIGSTITYLRRYTILGAFGLTVSDEDDDSSETADIDTNFVEIDKKTSVFIENCIKGIEQGKKSHKDMLLFMAERIVVTEEVKEIINLVKVK